ncbi:hypothetical protein K439DRAFT_1624381 [Ramaria rubella]|nr:hypothetical protein K439DRAFT_1624381 [Ramaria rubella]
MNDGMNQFVKNLHSATHSWWYKRLGNTTPRTKTTHAKKTKQNTKALRAASYKHIAMFFAKENIAQTPASSAAGQRYEEEEEEEEEGEGKEGKKKVEEEEEDEEDEEDDGVAIQGTARPQLQPSAMPTETQVERLGRGSAVPAIRHGEQVAAQVKRDGVLPPPPPPPPPATGSK